MSTARDVSSSEAIDAAKLIEDHQTRIWRYLRALGCDVNEADDLTQETFLSVIQRPFNQYNPAATAAYLQKVAYNRFISARRRSGKIVLMEQIEAIDQAWIRLVSDEHGDALIDALNDCLSQLTERARLALEMRFREKTSRVDIAKALRITEHGAKNLMQRAKKQLRTCVEGKLT